MRLNKLLFSAIKQQQYEEQYEEGNIKGICVVCSGETYKGLPLNKCISSNFSGWGYFFAGNCMCPECAFLFSDQTFRRKSWVASLTGFRIFKNDEATNILFSPPEPPFFIHIAKIGQKQTWLSCIHRVACNRNRYFFSHEKYDVPVLFERDKAQLYLDKAVHALNLGITKTELSTGEFKPKTWAKAFQKNFADFLKEVSRFKNNPLWEVIVDVARKQNS